ncbi:MAG: asparagine synthase (glutamine-hydrolyzing) [Halopseudomonas aestusnigri]
MCGITGFVGSGDLDDLKLMTQAISHRGPDGFGHYHDPDDAVFFGHRRLSIVDVEFGAQPMWNEDRTVAVTFNGAIYNHLELRKELEARGHYFYTDHSDTEVLVHGWEEWGEELPLKLNGMFAFAIWDKVKKRIFLARDRYGEKPLYWGVQKSIFFFGSELDAIVAHRNFDTKYNQLSLQKYFAHGFVPSPNSIFRDTHKLSPGSHLTYDLRTQKKEIKNYWKFRVDPKENPPSFQEATEEVQRLLFQSVKRRLMSDVPLGVFLSGGIDSSFATAAMCQFMPAKQVQSFSIGFTEKSFDETVFASAMAESLGTMHQNTILDLSRAKEIISDVLSRIDEPLADGSILPTYLLCEFASSKVKVALSGDGGDELFAGYDPFAALLPARIISALIPKKGINTLRRLADFLPKSSINMSFDFKVRRFLSGVKHKSELWNPTWLAPLQPDDISDLFNEPVDIEQLYSEVLSLWREDPKKSIIDKSLEYYSNFYLPDNILTKVDRASMLNGLETRSIFLDNDLVEYVRHLPSEYKIYGSKRKRVLKQAAQGLVPDDLLNRPKKGFGVPLQEWLKDIPLTGDLAPEFSIEPSAVETHIARHQSGKTDNRLFLWSWTVLKEFGEAHHR